MDRKPPKESKSFEIAGSFSGIGGLIVFLAGFVLEGVWSTVAMVVGAIGLIAGLCLVAVGNLIRGWD